MRIVIDTNVLLVSLPRRSKYHPIFLQLLQNRYELCLTSDILNEYEEVFAEKSNHEVATQALEIITQLPNIIQINKYFFWQLIHADPDDNKFVDCAIAASADFIVSDDAHFNILKNIDFPVVKVIGKDEFLEMLLKN
ncbi:MAG: putative toxin-antitoxin system toxin component, PIN family [Saprospiraceae bacterium]